MNTTTGQSTIIPSTIKNNWGTNVSPVKVFGSTSNNRKMYQVVCGLNQGDAVKILNQKLTQLVSNLTLEYETYQYRNVREQNGQWLAEILVVDKPIDANDVEEYNIPTLSIGAEGYVYHDKGNNVWVAIIDRKESFFVPDELAPRWIKLFSLWHEGGVQVGCEADDDKLYRRTVMGMRQPRITLANFNKVKTSLQYNDFHKQHNLDVFLRGNQIVCRTTSEENRELASVRAKTLANNIANLTNLTVIPHLNKETKGEKSFFWIEAILLTKALDYDDYISHGYTTFVEPKDDMIVAHFDEISLKWIITIAGLEIGRVHKDFPIQYVHLLTTCYEKGINFGQNSQTH